MVCAAPLRVRACGSTSEKSGAPIERARLLAVCTLAVLQREGRLRADDAVVVLDLVGEQHRAAQLRLRLLGERDRRRAIRSGRERVGDVLVEHAAQDRGPAIRDGVAVFDGARWRRGRILAARLGNAAARHHLEPACAARADHQHASCRHGLDQRLLMRLAGAHAGQDHRGLCGVGRRRHPGIDAEILGLHHAGPVERRRDAFHALAGGGEEGCAHKQQHQRAHSGRVEQIEARTRRPGLQRICGAQSLLDMRAPERLRHLILLACGKLVGDRCRGPVLEPARPIKAAQAIECARQAEAEQRDGGDRNEHDQDEQDDRPAQRRQPQPQAGP